MTTQQKGDLGVAMAIAKLTEKGYAILLPLTESAAYDLVVEKNGVFSKIQVKYMTGNQVDLRRIHSNSKSYVVKKYKQHSFDMLFVYKSTGDCYLVQEDLSGRSTLNPKDCHLI